VATGDVLDCSAFEIIGSNATMDAAGWPLGSSTGGTIAITPAYAHKETNSLRVSQTGAGSLNVQRSTASLPKIPSGKAAISSVFRVKVNALPNTSAVTIMELVNAVGTGVVLTLSSAGSLNIKDWSGTGNIALATGIVAGDEIMVEMTCDWSASTATYTARATVNGGATGATKTVTKSAVGATTWSKVIIGHDSSNGSSGTADYAVDSWVVLEGAVLPGDYYVVCIRPNADVVFGWTANGAGSRWGCLIETTPDTTSYLQSTTSGQIYVADMSTYTLDSASDVIQGLKPGLRLGGTAASSNNLIARLENASGTDSTLTETVDGTLSGFKNGGSVVHFVNPAGGAWVQTDLDDVRFKITKAASGITCRVTTLWIDVAVQAGSAATPASVAGGSADVSFGASGALTADTAVATGASGVTFGATGSLTAPANVMPAAAGVVFAAAAGISYPVAVVPAAVGVSFGAAGSVRAPTKLAGTGTVVFGATSSLTTAAVISSSSGVIFTGTGSIARAQPVAPSSTGVAFSGSGALTAPSVLSLTATGVAFGATGAVTSIPLVSGSAGVAFSGTGTFTALTYLSGTSNVSYGASGSLTGPTRVVFATSGLSFGATGSISAIPTYGGISNVSFGQFVSVTVPGAAGILPAASGVAFGAGGTIRAPVTFTMAGTGVVFGATGKVRVPALITFAPSNVSFTGAGTIKVTGIIAGSSGVVFGAAGTMTAAALLTGETGAGFDGTGSIAASLVSLITGSSDLVFGTLGELVPPTATLGGVSGAFFQGFLSLTTPFYSFSQLEEMRALMYRMNRITRHKTYAFLVNLLRGNKAAYVDLWLRWYPLLPQLANPDRDDLDDWQLQLQMWKLVADPTRYQALQIKMRPLVKDVLPWPFYDPYIDEDELLSRQMRSINPSKNMVTLLRNNWQALRSDLPTYDDPDDLPSQIGNW
jgi:hypothetical protein